jgi:hypothetical protein
VGWYFWTTLNWVHDPGGVQLLAGELLLIAGGCVTVFAVLVSSNRPFPLLEYVVGPLGLVLGAGFVAWGILSHQHAGLGWSDWDWEGEGR